MFSVFYSGRSPPSIGCILPQEIVAETECETQYLHWMLQIVEHPQSAPPVSRRRNFEIRVGNDQIDSHGMKREALGLRIEVSIGIPRYLQWITPFQPSLYSYPTAKHIFQRWRRILDKHMHIYYNKM